MKSMSVTIPDPMRAWVEARVQSGQYANPSDYIRDLIRRDQDDSLRRDALVQALIEGEESGLSVRSREEIIAAARADLDNEKL